MKFLFKTSLLFALILTLTCCGNKQKQDQGQDFPDTELPPMPLSGKDTTDVYELVKAFMDDVVNQDYTSAINRLVEVDPEDNEGQIFPMYEERKEATLDMLTTLPITKYSIEGVKFQQFNNNEVRVKVYLTDELSTNWYFKPVRYVDVWYLTMMDTMAGDEGLKKDK